MITHSVPTRGRLHPGETLDDLLRAWSEGGDDATCLVCGGETFPVLRRSGVTAVVCRSCGTSLEDDGPSAVPAEGDPTGGLAALQVA